MGTGRYLWIPRVVTKLPFVTAPGLHEWTVMPMCLTSAPSTFERLMESVLKGLKLMTCLIYLDDVVVYGRSFEEELERPDEVFSRFASAGLKLKPQKYSSFRRVLRTWATLSMNMELKLILQRLRECESGQCQRMWQRSRAFLALQVIIDGFAPSLLMWPDPCTSSQKLRLTLFGLLNVSYHLKC